MAIGINNIDPSAGLLQGAQQVQGLRKQRLQPLSDNLALAQGMHNLQRGQYDLQRAQEVAPIEDRMNELTMKQQKLALRTGNQKLEDDKAAKRKQSAISLGRIAKSAKSFEGEDRIEYIKSIIPSLDSMGLDVTQIDPENATDEVLDRLVAHGESLQELPEGGAGFQKGRTVLTNIDGQDYLATNIFDPNTGQTKTSISSVPGELVSALGETRAEQIVSRADEKYLTEKSKGKAGSLNTIRKEINKNATQAQRSMPKFNRLLSALDAIDTGKMASAKKILAPFLPGIDPSDEQGLAAEMNDLVLEEISRFTGAISEGEREFARQTTTNIGFTNKANRIILNRMIRTAQDRIEEREQFSGFLKTNKNIEEFEFEPSDIKSAKQREANKPFSTINDVKPEEDKTGIRRGRRDTAAEPEFITLPNGVKVRKVN